MVPAVPGGPLPPGSEIRLPRGVLLEAAPGLLRLVATDGCRLAMRELAGAGGPASPLRSIAEAAPLPGLLAAIATAGTAELTLRGGEVDLRLDGRPQALATLPGLFPPYEGIVAGLLKAARDRTGWNFAWRSCAPPSTASRRRTPWS